MSWTERVMCTPCSGFTDWVVEDGMWICHHCGNKMTQAEIKAMQIAQDAL